MPNRATEDAADATVMDERPRLRALAFRLLGTVADAEDGVQETYLRWYRMSQPERERIGTPAAWLTRVAGRICLDMLGSAHARRERYVGPWLPEPVPATALSDIGADPLDRVMLEDSVSMALLLVLETMTPAERVAFVLHDVFRIPFRQIADIVGRSPAACRQLASSARTRVRRARARDVPRSEHDEVVRRFAVAARTGDVDALVRVLDPAVVLRSDGGGVVVAARLPIDGPDKVVRFLLGLSKKWPDADLQERDTPGGLGFAVRRDGRIAGVATLEVVGGRISNIYLVVNPGKLSLWTQNTGRDL